MAALFQFENYINQLKNEIDTFPDDHSLWHVYPGISNSAGNLALHLAGNLQHFIGAILGQSGYVRQRELEFSTRNLTKTLVIQEIDKALQVTVQVLRDLSPEDKLREYPENFKGKILNVDDALSHLLAHLAYHTGQINYLRRLNHH